MHVSLICRISCTRNVVLTIDRYYIAEYLYHQNNYSIDEDACLMYNESCTADSATRSCNQNRLPDSAVRGLSFFQLLDCTRKRCRIMTCFYSKESIGTEEECSRIVLAKSRQMYHNVCKQKTSRDGEWRQVTIHLCDAVLILIEVDFRIHS